MTAASFDLSALFQSIDSERRGRSMSWAALAREVGVSASTIRRFGHAADAEADGVLALVRWLGRAPEDYVRGNFLPGAPLPAEGGGYVRVDMELVAKANADQRGARGRTRSSIQNLVTVAQSSGQTVASLTRISEV